MVLRRVALYTRYKGYARACVLDSIESVESCC